MLRFVHLLNKTVAAFVQGLVNAACQQEGMFTRSLSRSIFVACWTRDGDAASRGLRLAIQPIMNVKRIKLDYCSLWTTVHPRYPNRLFCKTPHSKYILARTSNPCSSIPSSKSLQRLLKKIPLLLAIHR